MNSGSELHDLNSEMSSGIVTGLPSVFDTLQRYLRYVYFELLIALLGQQACGRSGRLEVHPVAEVGPS